MIGFGDIASWVAQPVAQAVDAAFGTRLKTCSGCQERKERWNNFSEELVNHFWSNNKQGDSMAEENEKIEYLLQIAVMATDLKDASNQVTGGKIVAGAPAPKAKEGPQTTRSFVPGAPTLAPAQNPLPQKQPTKP